MDHIKIRKAFIAYCRGVIALIELRYLCVQAGMDQTEASFFVIRLAMNPKDPCYITNRQLSGR